METIRSSETSVDARSTQRHIPEDDILQRLRCSQIQIMENLLILNDIFCRGSNGFTETMNDHLERFTSTILPSISYTGCVPPNRCRLWGRQCSLAMFNNLDANITAINVRRNDRILGLSISRRSVRNYSPHGPGLQGQKYLNTMRTAQMMRNYLAERWEMNWYVYGNNHDYF
jgi:hypothetical protein